MSQTSTHPIFQNYQGGIIPINIGTIAEVELLELLGVGTFGTVWRVQEPQTKRLYVLKIIQALKPDSTLVERVRLEAEIVIPSEYIVPVLGLCEWNPSTFLILFEYFAARSLADLLTQTVLTPERKRCIFDQILQGVADAHHHNVIHRDLKPENILVGTGDRVKLIDFGLSKLKGKNLTLSGESMGTPPYMSPELLIHGAQHADARVDIYALGHILYEMSVGCTFWAKQGWSGQRFNQFADFLSQTPQPKECIDLTDFHCDFYPNASQVLAQMVKTDPQERYLTVDAVIQGLSIPDSCSILRHDRSTLPLLSSKPQRRTNGVGDRLAHPVNSSLQYPLLIVESGSNRNARTLINVESGEQLVLGRADIAGNDRSISTQHLRFTRQADRFFVQDCQSKNGTLLNGMTLTVQATPLHHGDRLKVGDIFLYYSHSCLGECT